MFRTIYVSHTRTRLPDSTLDALMDQIATRNAVQGISGILLYKSKTFFQVLEGNQPVIESTLDRVFRDPRHYKMKILLQVDAQKRRFNGWSMGFRRLDGLRSAHRAYFNLTRRDLKARLPESANKEVNALLRGYLMAKFPPGKQPDIKVDCAIAARMQA